MKNIFIFFVLCYLCSDSMGFTRPRSRAVVLDGTIERQVRFQHAISSKHYDVIYVCRGFEQFSVVLLRITLKVLLTTC